MRQRVAITLLSAVGASPLFVDDVVGDLEELAAQRREASQPAGAMWYAGELLRCLPHAVKDGVRSSALAAAIDVTQKAIAAWLLLAMAAVVVLAIMVFGSDAVRGGADGVPAWLRSNTTIVVPLFAFAVRYPLLGYVTVWIDARRPLITLLTVATLDAFLHASLIASDQSVLFAVVIPALAWSLIMLGGAWRLIRGPAPQDPIAARG